jgi:RNA polymerase sigma-70 factor (ECF subfamily)
MESQSLENEILAESLFEIAAGNKKTFKHIYELTAPKLSAIIKAMTKDESLTQDILQQAYISIWKNAGKFDPKKGKAFTWILVITRRKALDMIRSRRKFSFSEELSETLPDETMQSDLTAKSMLHRRILLPHLSSLSQNAREAILLNVVFGMSSREIGEQFGVPTHTAKSWVRRGLQKIKSEINVENIHTIL